MIERSLLLLLRRGDRVEDVDIELAFICAQAASTTQRRKDACRIEASMTISMRQTAVSQETSTN